MSQVKLSYAFTVFFFQSLQVRHNHSKVHFIIINIHVKWLIFNCIHCFMYHFIRFVLLVSPAHPLLRTLILGTSGVSSSEDSGTSSLSVESSAWEIGAGPFFSEEFSCSCSFYLIFFWSLSCDLCELDQEVGLQGLQLDQVRPSEQKTRHNDLCAILYWKGVQIFCKRHIILSN